MNWQRMAYAEFRRSYGGDPDDHRIIFFGLHFYLNKYLNRQWSLQELESTGAFLLTHNAGGKPFPWPSDLFKRVVEECDGWFPVEIRAVREGSVVYPHVPLYTITARGEWSGLVTFLETLLTISCWYPSTVATLSRRCRDVIESAFTKSVDDDSHFLLESRLHDFGFRACASLEQAVHGGAAHLLSFKGTDTLPAAYHVQYALNGGKPLAESIPASEHSVMMGFDGDATAMSTIIDQFGGDGLAYSIVMDTFDYEKALTVDLPLVAAQAKAKGGVLVIRPDSGDPVHMTLTGLEAAGNAFGTLTNGKGYKVITGAALIFGDGITSSALTAILDAVLEAGWSAQNVAFGMGSNLLHRVHRDTMSFATKVFYAEDLDGTGKDLAKQPRTDRDKFSLPGRLSVLFDEQAGYPVVYPAEDASSRGRDMLELVYDHGPVESYKVVSFDEMRVRLAQAWKLAPRTPQVISPALHQKISAFRR